MVGIIIGFVILSLVTGVVCFLTTSNLYFAIGILLIFILYFFIFQYKKFNKYYSLVRRVHSCYFFINSFVVTLSVKESYEEGYKSGLRVQDAKLHLYANELSELNDYEKVKYLRNYFQLAIYKMFLNVLEIYQDQGGNILNMSDNLIRECTRTEKTLVDSYNLGIKHLIEFIILWSLSFGVLLFLKFGIGDFYEKMLDNPIFAPLILVFFIIFLLSIHFFLKSFTNLSVKEDVIEWKK